MADSCFVLPIKINFDFLFRLFSRHANFQYFRSYPTSRRVSTHKHYSHLRIALFHYQGSFILDTIDLQVMNLMFVYFLTGL